MQATQQRRLKDRINANFVSDTELVKPDDLTVISKMLESKMKEVEVSQSSQFPTGLKTDFKATPQAQQCFQQAEPSQRSRKSLQKSHIVINEEQNGNRVSESIS